MTLDRIQCDRIMISQLVVPFKVKPMDYMISVMVKISICPARGEAIVTVCVLVMLDIYFVRVKYVFVCIKLMCAYVKLLKI
jgi:hypothetical protein